MKVKHVVFAAGAVTALGMAAPSFAQTVEIRISGASALQVSIRKTVAEVCDPALPQADRNYYISSTGETYTCTSRAAVFGGVARPVVIRKRDAGGSAFGVLNLNNPANVLGFTTSGGTCVAGGLVDLDPTAAVLNFNSFTGCSDVNLPVLYGVSDVEPRLFAGLGPVNNVTGQPILGQVFGLAASNNLAAALGASPSIRAVDYRAIVQGNYRSWDQVFPGNAALAGKAIKVCRRVVTSGTQFSSNVYFLANPCSSGAIAPADNTTDDFAGNNTSATAGNIGATGNAYTVVMNSAAGNVDACLTAANAQGEFAIGVLGTERVPGAAPADDPDGVADSWQFVRLNGVLPTVANAIAGDYDFVFDATWNRGTGIVYSAQQNQLANFFITTMGNPATINAAGLLGVAGLPDNGFDPTTQTPVLFGSHAGNSCSPILNTFP